MTLNVISDTGIKYTFVSEVREAITELQRFELEHSLQYYDGFHYSDSADANEFLDYVVRLFPRAVKIKCELETDIPDGWTIKSICQALEADEPEPEEPVSHQKYYYPFYGDDLIISRYAYGIA